MWYAIIAAVFLAVGLGLMIWALNERSKRHEAERAADKAAAAFRRASAIAEENGARAAQLASERERLEQQIGALRVRLDEAWETLAKAGDPAAIKAWLDKELAAEEL